MKAYIVIALGVGFIAGLTVGVIIAEQVLPPIYIQACIDKILQVCGNMEEQVFINL